MNDKLLTPKSYMKVILLHLLGDDFRTITRRLRTKPDFVFRILTGRTITPPECLRQLMDLGITICGCCKIRIVPLIPYELAELTRLCITCWTTEGGDIADDYKSHLTNESQIRI